MIGLRDGNSPGTDMSFFQKRVEKLFALADIAVNGTRPWDISVRNRNLFRRLLAHGSLGLGESYMDGWWDCGHIDQLVCRLFGAGIDRRVKIPAMMLAALRARLMNRQSTGRAFEIGRRYYDIGHDLYAAMLDSRMLYSCGFWKDAQTLDEAQENKLELICRKLRLEKGVRLLDIGCGWGGLTRYAAERYGVEVVGITVSEDQVMHARELCAGLPVEIRLEDYRALSGSFDRIVSVGMFEHVGYRNYRTFMAVVDRCLNRDGLFLLHTIGGNTSATATDPWIERYVFPNGMLPSVVQIAAATEGYFVLEDWQNFGSDYDRTLMAWWRRFEDSWPGLAGRYGERFHRMWRFYLLSCAGAFRAKANHLWQVVFSRTGSANSYQPER